MIIPVKTNTGGYNIYLERGILAKSGTLINLNRKVLIVTDSGVPESYSKTVASQCKEAFVMTINQGENSKNFDNYKSLLSEMVKKGFTRTDCVVAVGGGVVGDLAGFVASSYMRGVDFYNIPTTVLSQVDSSVGGKVAIDFEGFKNIVGAFYPPKAVIIDPDTLKTLDPRQISNGLAEAVKMALTGDKELFEHFEKGDYDIEYVIEKSLKFKKSVVEKDEKEAGLRKILNFGHTLAHAIETNADFKDIYHGEAVALGMIPMCSDEVKPRLLAVLKNLNLPTELNFDKKQLIDAVYHDKKAEGTDITVVFVPEVGKWEMRKISISQFERGLKI
ncbi:MAG: 3-dehydroquinate synthase [Clostridia bacterium]|nr:3-dehydroquinate synthase [Clostridia bacterium]